MNNKSRIIELEMKDLSSINTARLLAISNAALGACGEPGGVYLLMDDGELYHFNYHNSDIQPDYFRSFIRTTELKGTANLGLGNTLYFHKKDEAWLLEKRDHYMQTSNESITTYSTATLYKKWVDFFLDHIKEGA